MEKCGGVGLQESCTLHENQGLPLQ